MKDYAAHQLMEETLIGPKEEVDEEDVLTLLERTFGILETVLASRLPLTVRGDVIQLKKDVEDVICFHNLH
jgi:hypothetical protein